ncbi:hypothetical protein LTR93_006379 [Exophiala xenobiotica]|nr:hypothetical protein LTR93_006379 [Exophiala xenobiotica]KAK5412725.1 hypothetical protein LTR06_005696 [Exophiala xenobiotica]
MSLLLPAFLTNTPLHPSFDRDIRDTHLIYDYDASNPETKQPEKWRYEIWFFSSDRICNWLEETGSVVSLVYDITEQKLSTMISFSKGHWENRQAAHGDKRNPADFARWKSLAEIGKQTDRLMLSEQADILETFKGPGGLIPIAPDAVTL